MRTALQGLRKAWWHLRVRLYRRPTLTGRNHRIASRLLLDVTELCEDHGIDYFLDSGTLLGITRAGDLIPWDYDVDIVIPAHSLELFDAALPQLIARSRRREQRRYMAEEDLAWPAGAVRSIKIRDYRLPLLQLGHGRVALDVFVLYPRGEHTWWVMGNKVCRTSSHHFAGYHRLAFQGHQLRVPLSHEELLEHRYGPDWRTPDPDFDSPHQDGTIVRDVRYSEAPAPEEATTTRGASS
jgi:hypothetical protein